jgi:hypothetical protein
MPEGGYDLVFQDKRFLLVGRVRRRASVGVAMIRTTATAAACLLPIPLDLRRPNRMTSRTPAVAWIERRHNSAKSRWPMLWGN